MPVGVDISELSLVLGNAEVLKESDQLALYSTDETGQFSNTPLAVVKATEVSQIQKLVRWCSENIIGLNVWGRGSSLAGGSVPVGSAITLDLQNMNRILDIDVDNRTVWVEAGAITGDIQFEVKKHGLYYPVDPASAAFCSIGGNVNTNAGGPAAFKYGTTRRYVLDLEVVLMNGSVVRTGACTDKFSSGLNLTQLIVGSEGILAVVTKVLLKLLPQPAYSYSALFGFDSLAKGLQAVTLFSNSQIGLTAIEFMEQSALQIVSQYTNKHIAGGNENLESLVLISCDAFTAGELQEKTNLLAEISESIQAVTDYFADEQEAQDSLWEARRLIGRAVRNRSAYREVDTVVPVSKLSELIHFVKQLSAEYEFESVCYGHAGNGNLHINIIRDQITDDQWTLINTIVVNKLFEKVKNLGGALSGEHGIGVLNKPFMTVQYPAVLLNIMKLIKQAWDPQNLLNTGKVV